MPRGGVHKIQILIRDLLKEFLQKIFGEEMGGSGGPRPPDHLSFPLYGSLKGLTKKTYQIIYFELYPHPGDKKQN